ncbi:hypothetical protein DITRI_Ditri05aG0076100 [Diplodiscus trichospermus]
MVEGMLGKVGRQFYAVWGLGVILVSVTIAHFIYAIEDEVEAKDARERTKRRLRSLHGRFS